MISEICDYEKCTGCEMCASICHKNCIKMIPDEEGFMHPSIDKVACIDCGMCKRACPINNHLLDDGNDPISFAARHKDKKVRAQSSSGGVFSALAMSILEQNGIVVAAGFDENYQVVHKKCTEQNMLDELRRSKYAQSRIGNVYRDIKQYLDADKEVLFCGTPCQVSGIKAFLGNNYNNLHIVDFICHGVSSPLAWKKYMDFREKTAQSVIKGVSFRSKLSGWQKYYMQMDFQNGMSFCAPVTDDYYLRSFIMDMNLRPSCYNCKFKQKHRQADITLADFWGIECCLPSWNDDAGTSLVMIHSDKGRQLYDASSTMLESTEVLYTDAIRSNPSMTQSVHKPVLRDAFMKDLKLLPYDKLYRKYCSMHISSRIRRKIAHFIQN